MNAGKIFFVAIGIFSLPALAQTSPVPLAQSALNPDLRRLLQTSVIELDTPGGDSYCSSFAISSDGYLLTALHCLRQCLVAQGKMDEASSVDIGLQDLAVVPGFKSVQASCARLVNPSLGNPNVDVIVTGPAIAAFDSIFYNIYPVFYDDLKDRGWQSRANDFALVKIHGSALTSCLKLNLNAPSGAVSAVGFQPVACTPACNPAKFGLAVSPGNQYGSVKDSVAYLTRPADADRKWLTDQFSDPGVLFSSAANAPGQSGGPVLDASGSVVGIVSGYVESNPGGGREVHELTAVSMVHVFAQLPSDLAQLLRTKNQNCHP